MSRYRIALVVLSAFFLGMLTILGFGVRDAWRGWRSPGWPQVTGTILESSVRSRESNTTTRNVGKENRPVGERETTRAETVFYPEVKYRYEAFGRTCEGARIKISDGIDSPNPATAEALVAKYAVGTRVVVFHDPHDATVAVLEPGVSEGAIAQTAIGLSFSLMFGGLLSFALSKRGRSVIEALTAPQSANVARQIGRTSRGQK